MVPRLRFWNALGAAALVAALGVYASSRTGDWINFARSGAVIVIIGALITAWDSLRAGNRPMLLLRHVFSRERMPSETLGLCLIVVGTLIWAFGDLAGRLAP
jgi:drug/metabolite transporter (DMT)-like permease